MSWSGEFYLIMVIVTTVVFALGLAYYSARQARLDNAKRARETRAPAQDGAQTARGHA